MGWKQGIQATQPYGDMMATQPSILHIARKVVQAHPSRVLGAACVLLLGDFLLRLVFLAYNAGNWEYAGGDIPVALLVGLRFDLATLAIFNGWALLLMALPLRIVARRLRAWALVLLLAHLPVYVLNGIDVIYFGFASKRLSHELFSGGKDLAHFRWSDFLPYWWLVLLVLVMMGMQYWVLRRVVLRTSMEPLPVKGRRKYFHMAGRWGTTLVMGGGLFLGFRGGLQTRPLRPANAFVTSSVFLGNVSLNSAYTVAQSIEIGNEPDVELMPMHEAIALSRELVRNDFDGPFVSDEYPLLRQTRFLEPERRYNVVILIVESLNASKMGCIQGLSLVESLTPNLDTLARHGRLFTNFHSNGARSVQSLPAILNSTPDLFERPLIGSSFETNRHYGIGNMLAARGYHTSFVCGGPNGTMGFDSFSRVSGFQHYYGRNEYPGDASIACSWGLHDRGVLEWLAGLQEGFPEPFLNAWFSISNHHPFALPADCPAEISHSNLSAMDKTVRYTDWALGQYFKQVMQQPWSNNTVFILTGDHCFYLEDEQDRCEVETFHVPLLLLGPGVEAGVDDRVGSHVSIMPTLMEVLRLHTTYAGVGVSLLSQQHNPFSLTSLVGILALGREGMYVSSNLEAIPTAYRYLDRKWVFAEDLKTGSVGASMHQSLKAVYQVCSYMRKYNKQNMVRMED